MSGQERRRNKRARAKGLSVRLESGASKTMCAIEDISAGGIFVRSKLLFPVGTAVTLEIILPAARQPLRIAGMVANQVSPEDAARLRRVAGMGIQFENLPEATARRLQETVAALIATSATSKETAPAYEQPWKREGSSVNIYGGDKAVKRSDVQERKSVPPPKPVSSVASRPPPAPASAPLIMAPPSPPKVLPSILPSSGNPEVDQLLRDQRDEIERLRVENQALRQALSRQRS